MRRILGVDPGLAGALALVDEIDVLDVFDMPCVSVNRTSDLSKDRDEVSAPILIDIILDLKDRLGVDLAVLEWVNASPQMGATSAFRFGETMGTTRTALAAARVPVHLVKPSEWKGQMKLPGKAKDPKAGEIARARALSLYPNASHWLARKKDADRAEAILLAHWFLKMGRG